MYSCIFRQNERIVLASTMQYEDWEDAKQRIVSRYKFVKMHVI